MLFKNPNLLYGLLFLLIPIIVHLFQLRKFKKVAFSNVAFLKPLITQTRKSRTLKKWLSLLSRLLAITCIVFAFAQPYFPTEDQGKLDENLIIYLDNSYSMQAKGADGRLYQATVNDLVEKLPAKLKFSLFTNDRTYQNVTKQEIANELLTANYSYKQLTSKQVLLKAAALKAQKKPNQSLLWISDFQRVDNDPFITISEKEQFNLRLVKLEPVEQQNISIDTAFISREDAGNFKIGLKLTSNFESSQPVTISLINDNVLLAKTSATITNNKAEAEFLLSDLNALNGYLQIEGDGLQFDNRIYLSTNGREKTKLLHINDTEKDFLNRIFTEDEFDYSSSTSSSLNFNSIKEQQVIILNGVKNIAPSLATELNKFTAAGKTLVVVPSAIGSGYAAINGINKLSPLTIEKRITGINFDHPLLRDVFSNRISNFQYPKVNGISFNSTSGNSILTYDDGSSFLYQSENTFVFTAALNEENSNFQNSPLVVPVFYKLGLRNSSIGILYYHLGKRNEISFQKQLEQDQILELQLKDQRYIPEQRAYNSFVTIITNDELSSAGNYRLLLGDQSIGLLSFNASREENESTYFQNSELMTPVLSEIGEFIQELEDEKNKMELWKFFVAACLFFLICELLILKFIK